MKRRKFVAFLLTFILIFTSMLVGENRLIRAQNIAPSSNLRSSEAVKESSLEGEKSENSKDTRSLEKQEKRTKSKEKENSSQAKESSELNEDSEENASDSSDDPLSSDDSDEADDLINDFSKETSAKDLPATSNEEEAEAESNELSTKLYLNGESGDDNNDGLSSESPLKTFNKVKEKATDNQKITEIIVTGTTPIEGNISLQGTNAKVVRGNNFNGYLFSIRSGKTAKLSDIVIEGDTNNSNLRKALINVYGATLYIQNGTILRNNKTNARKYHTMGGAVHASNHSNVYMQAGLIENNTAVYGAGIYLTHSNLDFSAGTIRNNYAKRHGPDKWNQIYAAGGGICADNGSSVKISGEAKILNNRSDEVGGGVSIGSNQSSDAANQLLMQGGTIDRNIAGSAGGGIYIQAQLSKRIINKAKIRAGQITNNGMNGIGRLYKAFGGGGIYVNGITENYYAGGRVYHGSNGVLELYNAIVTDNYSALFGAGYASCPTSITKIYITDGVALYDNKTRSRGKDLFIISASYYPLHIGRAQYDFSKRMLGGVPYEWEREDGSLLPFDQYKGTIPSNTDLALHTDHTGNKLTQKLGKVIITGNYSVTCGAGIGSNGTVIFGKNDETTEIKVKKIWKADEATLPEKISVDLIVSLDGKEYVVETREITKEDQWETVFKNLPKQIDGKAAVYSVKEKELDGFISEVTKKSDTEFEILNKKAQKKIEIPVTKVWKDHENKDGIRPKSLTIKLFANGKDTGKSVELNEENGWKATFTNLPLSKDDKKIEYSLKEVNVAGYRSNISGDAEKGFIVTNTRKPDKPTVNISGSKTWNDNDNQFGKRPKSITVRLLADGKEVASKKVTKNDNWKWSFTGLAKYRNGKKIHYRITEDAVADYTSKVKDFDVTNSYSPGRTQIRVTKIWKDRGDQDDRRPPLVRVRLLANGKETGQELILSEANHWTGSFTDLDESKNGKKITYTVKELGVRGYTSTIKGDSTKGFTIINSHTPKRHTPPKSKISGYKSWYDGDNKYGKRPKEITIRLYANGVEIDKRIVTEADGWSWSFDNLDDFKNGKKIKYTISEDKVDGYLTRVNGYDLRNILEPSKKIPTKKIPIKDNPKTGDMVFGFLPFFGSLSLLLWIRKNSTK